MNLDVNDGSKPSRLQLDRFATGELSDEERATLQAGLGASEQEHLDAVEAARSEVRPFDAAALRARAGASSAVEPPAVPPAANRSMWLFAVPTLLLAAVAMMLLMPGAAEQGPLVDVADTPDIRFRGGDVQLFVGDGGQLVPWEGEALGLGDVVGFRVDATDHDTVVLLSIDGEGQLSILWPEGDAMAEPLRGSGQVPLPGTLTLDDAPGPETFIAVYDTPAPDAAARARHLHRKEGLEGLQRWADAEHYVDLVSVERANDGVR